MDRPDVGSVQILRGNALALGLADESVDLIVTSPPYFGLRSYQDGGEHYAGQIGDEPTPAEFVDALIAATAEMVRVLKPSGSIWVNLGDKYAGGGGFAPDAPSNVARRAAHAPGAKSAMAGNGARTTTHRGAAWGHRPKTLVGIPWRYAIRCIDDLGLILRAEVIWSKPNGLPESVTDRVRRSHEQWFHFTKEPRYFSAVDEIREAHARIWGDGPNGGHSQKKAVAHLGGSNLDVSQPNPLGKLPGSVWTIPTEPLHVPESLGIDHFAAFPTEWPRRIIQGWSPRGVCVECGAGRRPVVEVVTGETEMRRVLTDSQAREWCARFESWCRANDVTRSGLARASGTGDMGARWWGVGGMPAVPTPAHWVRLRDEWPAIPAWFDEYVYALTEVPKRHRKPRSIGGGKEQYSFDSRHNPAEQIVTGEACDCPEPTAPTTPGVVLDPFGGTGTTALVAKALGRHGISNDMSADYCRLAGWRTTDLKQLAKAARKPYTPPREQADGQLDLLEGLA